LFQGSAIAEFGDHVTFAGIFDDFNSSKYIFVIQCGKCNFFHSEQIISNLVVDGFESDELDCHSKASGNLFA